MTSFLSKHMPKRWPNEGRRYEAILASPFSLTHAPEPCGDPRADTPNLVECINIRFEGAPFRRA